jgi:hypothetical protein
MSGIKAARPAVKSAKGSKDRVLEAAGLEDDEEEGKPDN